MLSAAIMLSPSHAEAVTAGAAQTRTTLRHSVRSCTHIMESGLKYTDLVASVPLAVHV